jgi:hypothetical protein
MWWVGQMCFAVLVRSIMNMFAAHIPFALDFVKVSLLGYMMESLFRNQRSDSPVTDPAKVTTNTYVNVSLSSSIAMPDAYHLSFSL